MAFRSLSSSRNLLVIVTVLLAACGGATPQSLAAIDLEPLLLQQGDLPVGISGAQVRDAAPGMFSGIPKADKVISEQIATSAKQVGNVTVFLYAADADRDAAWNTIATSMLQPQPIGDLGERAQGEVLNVLITTAADVLFQRCHAVAHVRISGERMDLATATAYMKRLDKRLQQAVC